MAVAANQLISILTMSFFLLPICCHFAEARILTSSSIMFQRHNEWMSKYDRVYTSETEKKMRFEIFMKNVKYVDEVNADGNKSYKVSIDNQFSDYTEEEINLRYYGYNSSLVQDPEFETSFRYKQSENIAESMDWRKKGVLTPIKNQEFHGAKCGSCWAFASISTIEAVNKLKTGNLVSLSEQELIDCTSDNGGCQGGFPEYAFKFVKQYGVSYENAYPYIGHTSNCKKRVIDSSASTTVHINGFERMPYEEGEEGLLKAVANQPVVVTVKVGQEFRFYDGGVFDGGCGETLNHVVVAVGYGVEVDGRKYWILRNSWGEGWGEGGYMRMLRGSGRSGGVCGVGTDVSYPIA